jgi:hypothetical protein
MQRGKIQRAWGSTAKLARVAALAIACVAAPAWAAPADELKQLLEAGRAADAFALGQKHPDQLGDPTFDFYYGVASAESGHAGEAVLALERYILRFPDNVSARLQLARAYFMLGEDARAREEFEGLRKLDPPADVSATINRFLESIRLRETRYKPSSGLYIEAGIGSDSNVNGGPVDSNLFLPGFGSVLLAQSATQQSDRFTVVGAGGYFSYPVAPGISLYGNGSAEMKSNFKDQNAQFDLGNYNLTGGVSFLMEKELFRLSLNDGLVTLGSARYLSAMGGQAEWQHQLDERQSFGLGAQAARLTYPGANEARNADFAGLSASYRRLFAYAWQPMLSLSANMGEQRSRTQRPDLVPETVGGRIAVSFTPAAQWGVSLGFSNTRSHYKGEDILMGVTRRDSLNVTDLAVSYLISDKLSLRGEAAVLRNRSNIDLYSFPREIAAIKVRYEFK